MAVSVPPHSAGLHLRSRWTTRSAAGARPPADGRAGPARFAGGSSVRQATSGAGGFIGQDRFFLPGRRLAEGGSAPLGPPPQVTKTGGDPDQQTERQGDVRVPKRPLREALQE